MTDLTKLREALTVNTVTENDEFKLKYGEYATTTIEQAARSYLALLESGGWQPIGDIPPEGSDDFYQFYNRHGSRSQLVWCPVKRCTFTAIYTDGWMHFGGPYGTMLTEQPTHWMTLPTPPALKEEKQ